jgi:hypothetical protein
MGVPVVTEFWGAVWGLMFQICNLHFSESPTVDLWACQLLFPTFSDLKRRDFIFYFILFLQDVRCGTFLVGANEMTLIMTATQ